jgi:hypothetical protein
VAREEEAPPSLKFAVFMWAGGVKRTSASPRGAGQDAGGVTLDV